MDLLAPVLGLVPTLHVHASGALTFCGPQDEASGWDDDAPVLAVIA